MRSPEGKPRAIAIRIREGQVCIRGGSSRESKVVKICSEHFVKIRSEHFVTRRKCCTSPHAVMMCATILATQEMALLGCPHVATIGLVMKLKQD